MRIPILTGFVVPAIGACGLAQTATLGVDRVVVLKKDRTLELLRQGRVVKT